MNLVIVTQETVLGDEEQEIGENENDIWQRWCGV